MLAAVVLSAVVLASALQLLHDLKHMQARKVLNGKRENFLLGNLFRRDY